MPQITVRVLDKVTVMSTRVNTPANELEVRIDRSFDALSERLRNKLITLGQDGQLADDSQMAYLRPGFHVSFIGPDGSYTYNK